MAHDEAKKLKTGDLVSFRVRPDVQYRGKIDTPYEEGRWHRVVWLDTSKPRAYDVIDKRSPIWYCVTKQ